MDCSLLLDGLNEAQREAVAAPIGHYLVLAGAGSGKTRVLTYRIAWLINIEEVAPSNILALTFTNKAAGEMKSRIIQTIASYEDGSKIYFPWVGTFHHIAVRILKMHHNDANLPKDFQILDTEDQKRLIKKLVKLHNYGDDFDIKKAQNFISYQKEQGMRADHLRARDYHKYQELIDFYDIYQETCDRAGVVDFSEILLRCYELMLNNPTILNYYRNKFHHILVDEFQDTNKIQYDLIKLWAGKENFVTIVGDDDQSIYGWRGAKIENMQYFLQDYKGATTIRLEQNYRSSKHILNAANCIIANNDNRLGKKLWTDQTDGEKIKIYEAFNEKEEALYICDLIAKHHREGGKYTDCAILYRNNALSRVLEEMLFNQKIPYRIYGGLRFFDRAEIKDAVAYLRLIANRDDDVAFERIVNTPSRKIGNSTLETLRQIAKEENITMWQAISVGNVQNRLSSRALSALVRFCELINALDSETADLPLSEQISEVIYNSGLIEHFQNQKAEKSEERVDNLKELVSAALEFNITDEEKSEGVSELSAFLTHAQLEAGEMQASESSDFVSMMTLHSAKGLEFDNIFIVGVEEGIFPSQKSIDVLELDEERRLAYVGITRARKKLLLSFTESRILYGRSQRVLPSRFIKELPDEDLEFVRKRGLIKPASSIASGVKSSTLSTAQQYQSADNAFKTGDKVFHEKFGNGIVINTEGNGDHLRVQIAFVQNGVKWLIARVANLQKK